MTGTPNFSETHSLRGKIDRKSLITFRNTFEKHEPLASGQLDDFFNPTVLEIEFADGIGTSSEGRFDVRWSTVGDYNIHYSGDDHDFRWDSHQHDYPAPPNDEHFHPPPTAPNSPKAVTDSCMPKQRVNLIALATVKAWRKCYNSESISDPNDLSKPP